MHSGLAPFIVISGGVLSLIAGLMAYLISYDEALHRFPKPRARLEGLRSASYAFIFFCAVTAVLVVVI
jgi:hypothetical protein